MDRLFNTKSGRVILSVIWGLGIAALFYKVCQQAGCFVVQEKTTPVVQNHIYEFDDSCASCEGFNDSGAPAGGPCAPQYPPVQDHDFPPKCDRPLFQMHPPIAWYEHRMAHNCGDPRHCREPTCYKFNPTDTIFRAPSSQIYYNYH